MNDDGEVRIATFEETEDGMKPRGRPIQVIA